MNILLIGNGFDLAHGLPTKYDDFLDFISIITQAIIKHNDFLCALYNKDLNSYIWKLSDFDIINNGVNMDLKDLPVIPFRISLNFWKKIIENNLWINYFLANRESMQKNWIDFEKEICFVIKELDDFINKFSNYNILLSKFLNSNHYYDSNTSRNFFDFIRTLRKKSITDNISVDVFITELETDLEKLIFALEMYIYDFVNKIDVNYVVLNLDVVDITKVISFNYSNTFERIYDNAVGTIKVEYDYIHGKAKYHSEYSDNRLVLGINEYLTNDEKNLNVRFIRFKKYFQRIHKNTGCKYVDWLNEIKNSDSWHNLIIVGHSLDETDGDILRMLIDNDNVITTIFYHNREAYASQITNLVKVIGQDKLIERTGGRNRTIYFINQTE